MNKPERFLNRRIWLSECHNLHRVNGPAREFDDGTKQWLRYGNFVMDEPSGQGRRMLSRLGWFEGCYEYQRTTV